MACLLNGHVLLKHKSSTYCAFTCTKYDKVLILLFIIIVATMEDNWNENDNDIIDFFRPKTYTTPERRGTLSYSADSLTTFRQINQLLKSDEECQLLLLFLVTCLCHLVKGRTIIKANASSRTEYNNTDIDNMYDRIVCEAMDIGYDYDDYYKDIEDAMMVDIDLDSLAFGTDSSNNVVENAYTSPTLWSWIWLFSSTREKERYLVTIKSATKKKKLSNLLPILFYTCEITIEPDRKEGVR